MPKAAPSLADAMATVAAAAGKPLRVDVVIGGFDGDERSTLLAWLHDVNVKGHTIERALAEHAKVTGVDLTASSGAIAKWRSVNGVA